MKTSAKYFGFAVAP